MNLSFRFYALPLMLVALVGCATQGKPPPTISLDEPVQAQPLPESARASLVRRADTSANPARASAIKLRWLWISRRTSSALGPATCAAE